MPIMRRSAPQRRMPVPIRRPISRMPVRMPGPRPRPPMRPPMQPDPFMEDQAGLGPQFQPPQPPMQMPSFQPKMLPFMPQKQFDPSMFQGGFPDFQKDQALPAFGGHQMGGMADQFSPTAMQALRRRIPPRPMPLDPYQESFDPVEMGQGPAQNRWEGNLNMDALARMLQMQRPGQGRQFQQMF